MDDVKLIIENGTPKAIRNTDGYLFTFTKISKYPDQDERYRREIIEQFALADYLVSVLKNYDSQEADA